MFVQYIILSLLWLSFFTAHSILASLKVKDLIMEHTGLSARRYRLLYVLLSTVHLLVIVGFSATTESVNILVASASVQYTGLFIASVGVVVVMRAFKSYDGKAFLGLSDLNNENRFRRDGLLRYVRHPLYSGSIVLLLGFFLYIPTVMNAISVVLMIGYFLIGIRFEEEKLLKHFGERYEAYRRDTPMLIPRIFQDPS